MMRRRGFFAGLFGVAAPAAASPPLSRADVAAIVRAELAARDAAMAAQAQRYQRAVLARVRELALADAPLLKARPGAFQLSAETERYRALAAEVYGADRCSSAASLNACVMSGNTRPTSAKTPAVASISESAPVASAAPTPAPITAETVALSITPCSQSFINSPPSIAEIAAWSRSGAVIVSPMVGLDSPMVDAPGAVPQRPAPGALCTSFDPPHWLPAIHGRDIAATVPSLSRKQGFCPGRVSA
jgi:hypothetical protein